MVIVEDNETREYSLMSKVSFIYEKSIYFLTVLFEWNKNKKRVKERVRSLDRRISLITELLKDHRRSEENKDDLYTFTYV